MRSDVKGVVALLDARLTGGASSSPGKRPMTWTSTPGLACAQLSSSIAWNRRRIQNMILVVGPGTPASVLAADSGSTSSSEIDDDDDYDDDIMDDDDSDEDDDQEVDDEDDDQEVDDDDGEETGMDAEQFVEALSENDDDDDPMLVEGNAATRRDNGSENDGSSTRSRDEEASRNHAGPAAAPAPVRGPDRAMILPALVRRRRLDNPMANATAAATSSSVFPSLRHGGCINTACWLDAPWRFVTKGGISSSSGAAVVDSRECPTQLITSGDDRVVKVWDVSGAMGMDRVLSGGWNTRLPFGRNHNDDPMDDHADVATTTTPIPDWKRRWHDEAASLHSSRPLGTVQTVASLSTGHRGNVFHATPLRCEPGSILTCGADGSLRLCNMVAETSSVVVNMAVDSDLAPFYGSPMAYSHVSLSAHTGLLCSEMGLHAFDVRLSPREQPSASLLRTPGGASSTPGRYRRACKACALWNPHGVNVDEAAEMESYYVFAGGSGPTVGLYDIRMDASSKQRAVELYAPRDIDRRGSGVSVSGLDVSRSGKELLVSYENDQIYSFPIAHSVNRHPTVEDLDSLAESCNADDYAPKAELVSYGGHLNRFTFLKNARYAGPNDEYVLTGSDSGHAWIFERETGTVVSLLGADSATCNGVVPHARLPFFITYGIDSTAKLWRASPPVDPKSDDSPMCRASRDSEKTYVMSPVTEQWMAIQGLMTELSDEPSIFPENVPTPEEVGSPQPRAAAPCRLSHVGAGEAPFFGNAIESLPSILRLNMFMCYASNLKGSPAPVEHDVSLFSHRVSVSRLRHQADRLGLRFDAWTPWAFQQPHLTRSQVHLADLVPDSPSDWIKYDPKMRPGAPVSHPRLSFHKGYEPEIMASHFPGFFDSEDAFDVATVPWLPNLKDLDHGDSATSRDVDSSLVPFSESDRNPSRRLLYETVLLLKKAGNEAMKANMFQLAARRYDKAIQYCAVAYMHYPEGNHTLNHLTRGHYDWTDKDGTTKEAPFITNWTPLFHAFVACRLNLALLFLREPFRNPKLAASQAVTVLKLVLPYAALPGSVVHVEDGVRTVLKSNVPPSTFDTARDLLAKAYHRWGLAEMDLHHYSSAEESFKQSLIYARMPDPLTTRKLQEAKRMQRSRRTRVSRRRPVGPPPSSYLDA